MHVLLIEDNEDDACLIGELLTGRIAADIKLEWVDPIANASPLAPTNAQAAPETDNPVLARYAQAMPAVPQEWWQPLRK